MDTKVKQLASVTLFSYDAILRLKQELQCSDDALEWLVHYADWYYLSLNDMIDKYKRAILINKNV